MTFKCPDCGASLTDDSKFCKYCGAKIDDGVKRMEIKIDKRVEDVAEVKRASYEEKESLLRQKKMKRELRKGRAKMIFFCSCAGIGLVFLLIALIVDHNINGSIGAIGISFIIFPPLIYFLVKLINS